MRIFILTFFTFILHVHSMAQQMPPADLNQNSAQKLPDLAAPIQGSTQQPSFAFAEQQPMQNPLPQEIFQLPEPIPLPTAIPIPTVQQINQAPALSLPTVQSATQVPITIPLPTANQPIQVPATQVLAPTAQQITTQAPATVTLPTAQQVTQQAVQTSTNQIPVPPVVTAQASDQFAGQLAAVQQPNQQQNQAGPHLQQEVIQPVQVIQQAQQAQPTQTTEQKQTEQAGQPKPQGVVQIPGLPAQQDDGPKEIFLNFENTELSGFINYMAEIKNLNIIPDAALEGAKISLTIREPLSVDGAWNIFLTVLEMAGFSIIKIGEVYKIMPKDKKLNQPLPAYINVPADSLPDSDETIRYVFFLTNLQATDIEGLLTSMLSTPNVVIAQKEVNGFIITDKSYNIKSAVKLIQELDQMGLPEDVTVLRLKNANAADVKTTLDALITKPEGNPLARLLGRQTESTSTYFAPTTRVIAEERTNSLILLGKKDSTQRIIDFITKHIDNSLQAAESPLYIYELQYSDASQVADILTQVTTPPDSTAGQVASKYGAVRGGVKYFKGITFKVDKAGNRLVISCPDKQDWRLLKRTIKDLDKAQPQVAVETLIVVVSVTDNKELGGAIRNKKHGTLGNTIDFQAASSAIAGPALEQNVPVDTKPISLLGNMFSQLAAAQGQTVLSFGKDTNVWAVFKALQSQVNTSVLSQPFVTIANKTEANVVVGSTIRVVDSQSGTAQGFKDAVANTNLKLVPQINPDGIIGLDITLTIDSFTDSSGDNITNKNLKTNVTVADGQVLVLGGFVQTTVQETKTKTPILGDIPIIGWFFKNQTRTLTKDYTFVFLSPTIVKPRQTPGIQLYTKMKLHKATDEIEDIVETKRVMDPIHNWFFNPDKENYSHKVIDFANARYQPTTVDIKNDSYYRSQTQREQDVEDLKEAAEAKEAREFSEHAEQVSSVRDEAKEALKREQSINSEIKQEKALAQTQPQNIQIKNDMTPAQAPVQEPVQIPAQTMQQETQRETQREPAQIIKNDMTPEIPTTQQIPEIQTAQVNIGQVTDDELEQRRAQFKAMMKPAQTINQDINSDINREKRQNFKDLITSKPEQPSQSEEAMFAEKRNKLKEFLAANPTLASNSAQQLKQVAAKATKQIKASA